MFRIRAVARMTCSTDQAAERYEQSRRMDVELRPDDGEGQVGSPSGQALEALKATGGPLDPERLVTPNSIVAAWAAVGLPTNKITTTGFFDQAGERGPEECVIAPPYKANFSSKLRNLLLGRWSLPARGVVFA